MPRPRRYTKKRRSRRRRPFYKRRTSKRRRLVGFQGVPAGIRPNQRIVKLRYATLFNLSSVGGVLGTHVFRANSLYDPDYTGTGHQPMLFDELSAYFRHYVVLGSKIWVKWTKQDSISDDPCITGVHLDTNSTSGYTSADALIEARKGSSKMWTGKEAYPTTTSAKFSAKKFFSVTNVKDNIDEMGALVSADPTKLAYYILWCQAFNTGTEAFSLSVVIDYVAMFSDPKSIGQS